jgi:nitronate monooxygenase
MLRSRLTERFQLDHPVISAPMGFAAGGKLAAAVSAAGGLGLIGAVMARSDGFGSKFRLPATIVLAAASSLGR